METRRLIGPLTLSGVEFRDIARPGTAILAADPGSILGDTLRGLDQTICLVDHLLSPERHQSKLPLGLLSPEPSLEPEVVELLGDIVIVVLCNCQIRTVKEGEMRRVIGLSEFAEHVARHGVDVCLVVGIMEFGVDLGRLSARRRQRRVLGHRVVPLHHAIGIEKVGDLAEARNVHDCLCGDSGAGILADFPRKGSRS